jgi:hypothetical protein
MKHEIFDSAEDMLAPSTLSALIGVDTGAVCVGPFREQDGVSGSQFCAVTTDQGARFVVKRMAVRRDWQMQASDDRRCRAVALWRFGLLGRLTPTVDNAILACARDGDGWALLMRDVTHHLIGKAPRLSALQIHALLDVLAAIHATFWDAVELREDELGLCDAAGLLQALSVETLRRSPEVTAHSAPQRWLAGWPLLQEQLAPDVADVLQQLMLDPDPLCAALARYPATLVHGDFRETNIGLAEHRPTRAVVLDWQLAGYGAATIDLAWFLTTASVWLSPLSPEAATACYRQALARQLGKRFSSKAWQPLLELGLLANVLRKAPATAWSLHQGRYAVPAAYAAAVDRWLTSIDGQVRDALRWL